MFCAWARGAVGTILTCTPLTFSGSCIMPLSSIISKVLRTTGYMVSLINLPNAEPRFCDNSESFAVISVAERADILSGVRLSSSIILLIACLRSLATIWESWGSPERGKGLKLSPCGPPFLATGMIAPGNI